MTYKQKLFLRGLLLLDPWGDTGGFPKGTIGSANWEAWTAGRNITGFVIFVVAPVLTLFGIGFVTGYVFGS